MITNEELLAPLKARLEQASGELERIDILNEMGFELRFRDTTSGFTFAEEALRLAEANVYVFGIAQSALTLGYCTSLLARHDEAISYALKSLYSYEELEDDLGKGKARLLIGSVNWSMGNYDQALSYAMAGMKALEASDDVEFAGWGWNIMGGIHQSIGDIDQAVAYFDKAMRIFKQAGNTIGVARVMNGLALALDSIGSPEESLEYSREALLLHKESGNKLGEARSLNDMGLVYFRMGELAEAKRHHEEALLLRQNSNNPTSIITSLLNLGVVASAEHRFEEAIELLYEALDMANSINAKPKIFEIHFALSKAFEGAGEIGKAFEHYKHYHEIKEEVLSNESTTRLRQLQTTLATEKAERENALERQKNKELAEANGEIHRQMAILDEQATEIEIANAVLEEKNLVITDLHAESERLLLNVLPAPIATRLKAGERAIADHYNAVTVLFADIVGFTKLSQTVSAQALVEGLNTIFGQFDALAIQYGLEKIKTIGDAYMVAGGLPERISDHAERVARFALAMQEVMRQQTTTQSLLGNAIEVRIGIHTGEAVAGVIGTSKFSYDLWGDTVNTASRMESHGEAGKIHVSEGVYRALGGHSSLDAGHSSNDNANAPTTSGFLFEERGEMEVKGKGLMRTWFLKSER